MSAHRIPPMVDWAMLCKGGPSVCARCRDPSPEWHEVHKAIRINSIRIPQEDMWRALLSGLPQGELHGTREHHTRMIAYPIRMCCPDHWLNMSKPCYSPHFATLQWCVRTPCPDIFAMDSKELSSISDCFGDQKAIKTPKLNTIWLELIARVLNMLIGLKRW